MAELIVTVYDDEILDQLCNKAENQVNKYLKELRGEQFTEKENLECCLARQIEAYNLIKDSIFNNK